LHVNFQLNKAGEAIGLFAADGTQVDAITFEAQTSDVSQGRCPDGGTNIIFMPAATPRAANSCGNNNTAPVLMPIGNKSVHQGQTLAFTAHATDSDVPAQTLTFSLDPGAPATASITSGGAFTWLTTNTGTNHFTVRVTDNGSPPVSASEMITVIVVPPLDFGTVIRNGDQLTLGWQTAAGQTYRVEFSDDLSIGSWMALGPDLPAGGGGTLSVTVNAAGPPAHRFYRVRLVQ